MSTLSTCCSRASVRKLQNSIVYRCVISSTSAVSHCPKQTPGVGLVRLLSSKSGSGKSTSQAAIAMQRYQGKDHEFADYRSRDTMDRAAETVSFNMEANLDNLAKADQNRHDSPQTVSGYGMENVDQQELDRCEIHGNRGEVSLSSVMQSNVPEPFNPHGRNPSHMNMPGGGSGSKNRYLYSNIHGNHPSKQYSTKSATNVKTSPHIIQSDSDGKSRTGAVSEQAIVDDIASKNDNQTQFKSSSEAASLTQRQKLQRAIKEYGSTVIVFHVALSLASLGGFYLAVSSGLDVVGLLSRLGVGENVLQSRIATGGSTFVVAYAVHKVFAPVRIAITLTCTPFIVRYLRRIGFLKAVKPKVD